MQRIVEMAERCIQYWAGLLKRVPSALPHLELAPHAYKNQYVQRKFVAVAERSCAAGLAKLAEHTAHV